MPTWSSLLSARRIPHTGAPTGVLRNPARTDFQRDADRVVFSSAFRRMHDKTQVYPLPDNDLIHSRLTHSLEVSSVGRSLGTIVGQHVIERHARELPGLTARDIGDIVAAACLAHDIGNPPFGHSGEDAIAQYFRASRFEPLFAWREWQDLVRFEGNAQGFRILTRLQMEYDGGMRLTAAALAAFTKYPRESGDDLREPGNVATNKHGFFQSERSVFESVATEVGLVPRRTPQGGLAWARHPLAFLVEAADDISYLVLDLEDALRLGYAPRRESEDMLEQIGRRGSGFRIPGHGASDNDRVAYLRAKAINQLILEVRDVFLAVEGAAVDGTQRGSLVEAIPSGDVLHEIRELSHRVYYNHRGIREVELAGYEVMTGLLETLVPPALAKLEQLTPREHKLLSLAGLARSEGEAPPYARVGRVMDYISGMTDGFALTLFRRLKGIEL